MSSSSRGPRGRVGGRTSARGGERRSGSSGDRFPAKESGRGGKRGPGAAYPEAGGTKTSKRGGKMAKRRWSELELAAAALGFASEKITTVQFDGTLGVSRGTIYGGRVDALARQGGTGGAVVRRLDSESRLATGRRRPR